MFNKPFYTFSFFLLFFLLFPHPHLLFFCRHYSLTLGYLMYSLISLPICKVYVYLCEVDSIVLYVPVLRVLNTIVLLFSLKKGGPAICDNMGELDWHNAKWNKPDIGKKYCMVSLISGILKKWNTQMQRVERCLSGMGRWGKWRAIGQRVESCSYVEWTSLDLWSMYSRMTLVNIRYWILEICYGNSRF